MSYHTRSAKRVARKGKRNLIFTILILGLLLYTTVNWILPAFVNSLGSVNSFLKPSRSKEKSIADNPLLAPPVLDIPFEATNSGSIKIKGYAISRSRVKIYLDDQLKDEVSTNEDGSFETDSINLSLGTNNIFGKTEDENAKESLPSKIIKIIYDNEKPNLEVNEPQDGATIEGTKKVKISGQTEPEAQIFVNDTRIITNSEGIFNTEINVNDGENLLTIKSIDKASNVTEIVRAVTVK